MKPFNRFTESMPSSGIRKIMALSEHIDGCIHLEVGQPDFETPSHIEEAASKAALEGFTKYTHSAGIMELREALAEKITKEKGFKTAPENIVLSPGAVCSIYTSLLAIAEPGDDVLVPDPGWPNYMMQMVTTGLNGVRYKLDKKNGFTVDINDLENAVTSKTKVLMINTPGNPTGAVFTREDMKKIYGFAQKHDLFVISDEVYENIIFEGNHVSLGEFDTDGRCVIISSFSKTYAMTGFRAGYAVCDKTLTGLLTKIQEPVVSCASSITQKACVAAVKGPQEAVGVMVKAYKERRDAAVNILREKDLLPYIPHGAFYMLIDISEAKMNSTDFAVELLDKYKVAVAPGETFGPSVDSYIRICFAVEKEKLETGVRFICEMIEEKEKRNR